MSKIGSPRKNLVYDDNGNLVDGLSIDKSTGTYIAQFKDKDGKWSRKGFGKDEAEAISKYRSWEEERQGGKLVTVTKPSYMPSLGKKAIFKLSDRAEELLKQHNIDEKWFLGFILAELRINEAVIPEDFIYSKAAELIRNNPIIAAQKMKMPFFADRDFMKKYKPTETLLISELWENYATKRGIITEKELADTKASWTKFIDIVNVKTASELTKEVIRKYYDTLYGEYNRKMSTTWIKSHFERVKRVINYALDSLDDISDLLEVKQRLASVLKPPKASILCPAKRIPKELFLSILEASNNEEKAMWLLSLNLAYYTIDIATLPLSHINFKNKTVIFRRGKTGVHRAGVLWNETIKAIMDYQKEKSHNSELLFYNLQNKQPYEPNRIRKKFNKVLENLGIRTKSKEKKVNPNNFKHSHFRDSFESICAAKNIPQQSIDAVMGHTGISTKYTDVESTPEITAPACQAVREFYFGNKVAS